MREGTGPYTRGRYTPFMLATVVVLILLALQGGRARRFSTGFMVGWLSLTIFSMGSCTEPWNDPIVYFAGVSADRAREKRNATEEGKREIAWRDSLRTQRR